MDYEQTTQKHNSSYTILTVAEAQKAC